MKKKNKKNDTKLTEEMILNYFKKLFSGDINDDEVRKNIVKIFIREIVVYENYIVIIYNFTDRFINIPIAKNNKDFDIEKLKTNLITSNEIEEKSNLTYFFSNDYFGIKKYINRDKI